MKEAAGASHFKFLSLMCLWWLSNSSSVTFGNSFDFVLLSSGEWVGSGSLGGVDNFVSEAFSHTLHGTERSGTGSLNDQVDTLVNTTERWDIDGLTTDNTTGTNTGGIFTGTSSLDGWNENLDGVCTGDKVDDFHGLFSEAESHLLFTVVAASSFHEHAGESFNDRALSLLESTLLITSSSEGNENALFDVLNLEVSLEGDVRCFDVVVAPFSEQCGGEGEFGTHIFLFSKIYAKRLKC
jgi:hypothetical protein